MLQNSKSNKISFVYFYSSGDRIPIIYSAIAGIKEFGKDFEFLAVTDPSKLTMHQLNIERLPALIGGLPTEQDPKTKEDVM